MNEELQLVVRNDECIWLAFDDLNDEEVEQAAWRNDAFSQYLDGMKHIVETLGIADGRWTEDEEE